MPLAILTTMELGQLTSQMFGLAQYVADGLIGSYMMPSESLRISLTSPSQSGLLQSKQQAQQNYSQSNLSVIL